MVRRRRYRCPSRAVPLGSFIPRFIAPHFVDQAFQETSRAQDQFMGYAMFGAYQGEKQMSRTHEVDALQPCFLTRAVNYALKRRGDLWPVHRRRKVSSVACR